MNYYGFLVGAPFQGKEGRWSGGCLSRLRWWGLPRRYHGVRRLGVHQRRLAPVQSFVPNDTINGHGACFATSVINSFLYLQKRYPGIYDSKLIGTGEGAARPRVTRCTTASGTGPRLHVAGSLGRQGELDRGPGKGSHRVPGHALRRRCRLEHGWPARECRPTWDFLWKEISDEEDVEIFFSWE